MIEDILSEIECLLKDYGVPTRGRGRRFPDLFKSRILKLMQSSFRWKRCALFSMRWKSAGLLSSRLIIENLIGP
jgi:hypothetical protein